MNTQAKRDVIAGLAVTVMFVGAFLLSVTKVGLIMLAGGAVVMVALMVFAILERD